MRARASVYIRPGMWILPRVRLEESWLMLVDFAKFKKKHSRILYMFAE